MIDKTTTTRQLKWLRHQMTVAVDCARGANKMLIDARKHGKSTIIINMHIDGRNLWMDNARSYQDAVERIIIQKLSDE